MKSIASLPSTPIFLFPKICLRMSSALPLRWDSPTNLSNNTVPCEAFQAKALHWELSANAQKNNLVKIRFIQLSVLFYAGKDIKKKPFIFEGLYKISPNWFFYFKIFISGIKESGIHGFQLDCKKRFNKFIIPVQIRVVFFFSSISAAFTFQVPPESAPSTS